MQNDLHRVRETALVTGASSGIGYEFAKRFARGGFNLVLVARDELRLTRIAVELERESNVAVKVVPKDLSQRTAAEELYRRPDRARSSE